MSDKAFWFRRLSRNWYVYGAQAWTHTTLERYLNWAHPLSHGWVPTLERR